MPKRMRNRTREKQKELDDLKLRIKYCLDSGISTRKDIAKSVGITVSQLANLFHADRELYAKFCVVRRTIVDVASDNLFEIVHNPKHPKNAEISKWVVSNYKSDLDESLEGKAGDDGGEVEINNGDGKTTRIIFGRRSQSEN